ncbi:hypothetical protein D6D06_08955 [Aureobasidium pullulans]|nr:hypothetical protein D6D06_08955 [Aureobasidium pullulans]
MKDPTSSPSPVRRGASTKSSQYERAHHQQYSSPSDLGCNITTENTRSSDVLDLPFSGVTLVIVSSASPVAAVSATTSRDASLAPTTTRTATTTRERTTSTTATATLITTVVRVFGGRPFLAWILT